jgi:hypothetical protein
MVKGYVLGGKTILAHRNSSWGGPTRISMASLWSAYGQLGATRIHVWSMDMWSDPGLEEAMAPLISMVPSAFVWFSSPGLCRGHVVPVAPVVIVVVVVLAVPVVLVVSVVLVVRVASVVPVSTSSATQHRRLLNIVGYSTSSFTQHRRWLNIVNLVHNRNEESNSESPGLLDLTDY